MDENRPQEAPRLDEEPAPPPADEREHGSIVLGFFLFWICTVAVLVMSIFTLIEKASATQVLWVNGFIFFALLALNIWLAIRRSRTAQGVLVGYASFAALFILLLSICSR